MMWRCASSWGCGIRGRRGFVQRDNGDGSFGVLLDDNDGSEIRTLALDGVTPAVGARVVLLFVNGGRVGVILGTVQG